ncbi:hypothetical protein MALU111345_00410 [Marinicrinis lubricantis]
MLLLKRLVKGLSEQLFIFPIYTVLYVVLNQEGVETASLPLWIAAFTLLYTLGSLWKERAHKWRMYGVILSALITSAAAAVLIEDGIAGVLLLTAVNLFAYLRGVFTSHLPWNSQTLRNMICLLSYFISVFLFAKVEPLEPYQTAVTVLGISILVIYIGMQNIFNLKDEASHGGSSRKIPRRTLMLNAVMVFILLAAMFILFSLKWIQDAAGTVMNEIKERAAAFFRWLNDLLASDEIINEPMQPQQPMAPFPTEETEETWWTKFLEVLEQVMSYLVIGLLVLLIPVLLWFLWKKAIPLLRRFSQWLALKLQQSSGEVSEAYEDVVEAITDPKTDPGKGKNKPRGRRLFSRFTSVSNREKAIDQYMSMLRKYVKKGLEEKPNRTSLETGRFILEMDLNEKKRNQAVIELYNKVKYGDKDVTDDELKKLDS